MNSIPRSALALVLAAYLLPLALPVPLMEDDEGLHAAIAQEMVEQGDWVVPRLMGEPFLDKPILYFWMEAASLLAFGATEFAVRLPGTVMGLAGALAVGWLAGTMFGGAAGTWAALCYATMLLPFAVSLVPLHDLVMVPLVCVAIGALWHARHALSSGATARWTLVAGVALGLSVLGKGLTGVGLVGVGVAVWLLWTGALSWRLVAVGGAAVALAALIAWPWYAAMERAVPGYLHYFFLERHVAGITGSTQRHAGRPFLYYVPVLLAGTWPWSIFLLRKIKQPLSDGERLLWSWLAADVLVLSLAGSKLATYVLPVVPAIAALAALACLRQPASDAESRGRQLRAQGAGMLMAALPLAGIVGLATQHGWPAPSLASAGWALVSIAVACWTWTQRPADGLWRGPAHVLLVSAAALLVTALVVRPIVAERLTARALATRFNADGALPPHVWLVDEGIGSLVFYLREDLRRGLTTGQIRRISRFSTPDLRDQPADGVLAVASDRVEGLAAVLDLEGVERPPAGQFLLMPLANLRVRAAPGR